MPEYLGPVLIPEIATSGTWPFEVPFGLLEELAPQIVVHQFGHGERQAEQRFYLGPGRRTFRLSYPTLSKARRDILIQFFEDRKGIYQPFTLNIAQPDGSTRTLSARFAQPTLAIQEQLAQVFSSGIELVEEPSVDPSYSISSTLERFPSTGLKSALLDQVQEVVPLIRIETGDNDVYVSDRRITVGGTLYQPRLLDWDGIGQTIDGAADTAAFVFGNTDRVWKTLAETVDLDRARIEFSLFHVGSTTKVNLWAGNILRWAGEAASEFRVEASDPISDLRLLYPAKKITRDWVKVPNQPVSVGGKKGISKLTATSVINDTCYGRPLKDIYVNSSTALPVPCEVAAGRDESEFYAALGIVGRGPISGFSTDTTRPHTLDGEANHGPGNLGLRRSYGGNPTTGAETPTDNSPDSGSDIFALDETGNPLPSDPAYKIPGLAFLQIRKNDTKGIQPLRPDAKTMIAQITQGLGCYTWTAPGTRVWTQACTNPVWIAVNVYLRALEQHGASAATQETLFDCQAAIDAAAICDTVVAKVIGAGTEKQFTFQGILGDEKPLRDWLREILGSCLGYFTFAGGKLRIGMRVNSSTVEAFTAANILMDSLQPARLEPECNHLTVSYADVDYGWQANALELKDTNDVAIRGLRKMNVNLVGVSSKSQAARLCTVKLREALGGLSTTELRNARLIPFRTTVLALNVEPGMVCSMTHDAMPGGGPGEFRVQSWRLNRDWSIDIQGRSIADACYDLTTGPKPTDITPDPIPTSDLSLIPGDVTDLSATIADSVVPGMSEVTVNYTPPDPVGSFSSVQINYRVGASGDVKDGGRHEYTETAPAAGKAVFSIPRPDVGPGGELTPVEVTIWVRSCSELIVRVLDPVNTPSVTVDVIPWSGESGVTPAACTLWGDAVVTVQNGRATISQKILPPEYQLPVEAGGTWLMAPFDGVRAWVDCAGRVHDCGKHPYLGTYVHGDPDQSHSVVTVSFDAPTDLPQDAVLKLCSYYASNEIPYANASPTTTVTLAAGSGDVPVPTLAATLTTAPDQTTYSVQITLTGAALTDPDYGGTDVQISRDLVTWENVTGHVAGGSATWTVGPYSWGEGETWVHVRGYAYRDDNASLRAATNTVSNLYLFKNLTQPDTDDWEIESPLPSTFYVTDPHNGSRVHWLANVVRINTAAAGIISKVYYRLPGGGWNYSGSLAGTGLVSEGAIFPWEKSGPDVELLVIRKDAGHEIEPSMLATLPPTKTITVSGWGTPAEPTSVSARAFTEAGGARRTKPDGTYEYKYLIQGTVDTTDPNFYGVSFRRRSTVVSEADLANQTWEEWGINRRGEMTILSGSGASTVVLVGNVGDWWTPGPALAAPNADKSGWTEMAIGAANHAGEVVWATSIIVAVPPGQISFTTAGTTTLSNLVGTLQEYAATEHSQGTQQWAALITWTGFAATPEVARLAFRLSLDNFSTYEHLGDTTTSSGRYITPRRDKLASSQSVKIRIYAQSKDGPLNATHLAELSVTVPAHSTGTLPANAIKLDTTNMVVLPDGSLSVEASNWLSGLDLDPSQFVYVAGKYKIDALAVNVLVGGAALFTSDVTFERSSGGKVVINGDGVTVSRGSNSVAIGASSIVITGPSGNTITINSSQVEIPVLFCSTSVSSRQLSIRDGIDFRFTVSDSLITAHKPLTVSSTFTHSSSSVSLSSPSNWRTAMGLGNSATLNLGTGVGTVAEGSHDHAGVYAAASHNHDGYHSLTGHQHSVVMGKSWIYYKDHDGNNQSIQVVTGFTLGAG